MVVKPYRIVTLTWVVLVAYWLISASRVKRTKRAESIASRLAHVVPTLAACILMFSDWARYGFLGERFLPRSEAIHIAGCALTVIGAAFAIWARHTLGENWSGMVKLRVDHELIRTGPYALVRHPIYSGILLGLLGSAMVIGEWRAVVGWLLIGVALIQKARTEEALLKGEFGEAFAAHRKATGFLVPRLRRA